MTDTKNEYITEAKKKLDALDERLIELETRAKSEQGIAQRELRSKLDAIRQSKLRMERRVEEMRLASKPAWEDVKQGAEEAWEALSHAVDKASARFQSDDAGTSRA
jgi:hypothetical protein